jgi:hypothetical protein
MSQPLILAWRQWRVQCRGVSERKRGMREKWERNERGMRDGLNYSEREKERRERELRV